MTSESIAGFLDRAKASQVLFPEQVEQLIRQPDMPLTDLTALCEYLLARGVLTKFQAEAIRTGRGQELSYANYPVIDIQGPCPGGTAYTALHPSLRTTLVLRRLSPDWFPPADTPANYLGRVRSVGMLSHTNLVHLLDAGMQGEEVYLVIDRPADVADLDALAREVGGAMPGFLAAEYGRAVASALRLAHERGGVHGDIRPANLLVGPLSTKTTPEGKTKRRPAPDAVVRLAELGLVPVRPAASSLPPDLAALPYLPPERVDAGGYDPRGDIYGLGATLYFLLSGRAPFVGEDAIQIMDKVRLAAPTPLPVLRPDLPPDLVSLVGRMMEKQPERRPQTALDVELALAKFCRPGTVPLPPAAIPMAAPVSTVASAAPVAFTAEVPEPEPADGWGVGGAAFSTAHADAAPKPRKRAMTAGEKTKGRLLILLGLCLHLTAIGLVVAWALGAFSSDDTKPDPAPTTTPKKGNQPIQKRPNG